MRGVKIKKQYVLDPDEILADSISVLNSSFNAEGKLERSLGGTPSLVFLLSVIAGLIYLFWQALGLQLGRGDIFYGKAQENRFAVRPIFSPRGIIFDFKDRPLVENLPAWGLVFSKEKFLEQKGDLQRLINMLRELLSQPEGYFFDLGFPKDYDSLKIPSQIFMPQNIPLADLVAVASNLNSLPGIEVVEGTRRFYKDPYALSHLLGFTGKISLDELRSDPNLKKELMVGKTGLEAQYDNWLRGRGGRKLIEIDARGRETRFKFIEEPKEGLALKLTIDGEMQKRAYDLLKHYTGGKSGGSLVALDPRDGSVRALVSFPGFDSNNFGYSLSEKEFTDTLNDPLKPFFNRAVAGEFPSGSIIKPIIAAAALQEKLIDPEKKIYDPGYLAIPNPYRPGEQSLFKDWRKHGWINFYDALTLSANVYFYILGGGYKDQPGLGIYKIKKYMQDFGLGSKTGLALPGEKAGFIPDPETKKNTQPENPVWRVGDTYNVSIGQGELKVTPLQMAVVVAALANGGKIMRPRILADEPVTVVRENIIDSEYLEKIKIGMLGAVTRGTSRGLQAVPVPVASKTGTAQVSGGKRPHSWAITFAPADSPELVIASMGENGGEGAVVAVPVARDLYKWYFSERGDNQLSTAGKP